MTAPTLITSALVMIALLAGCERTITVENPSGVVRVSEDSVDLELSADLVIAPDALGEGVTFRMLANLLALFNRFPLALSLTVDLDSGALCGRLTAAGLDTRALQPCQGEP